MSARGPRDLAQQVEGRRAVRELLVANTRKVHDLWLADDAAAGLPERVVLERASRVHLTDAGGGALQWVYVATDDDWTLQATLWPGSRW